MPPFSLTRACRRLSPIVLAFRIQDGMTRYFSVHDAVDVIKAVIMAALLTYVAVFSLTRLEGVPRSTPIIHARWF
jgi:FlaA1/EpsC-like NDP-sugar epimerase